MKHGRFVAAFFALSMLASIAFATFFATGADAQLESISLTVALGAFAAALVVWEHAVKPDREESEEREPLPSEPKDVEEAIAAFEGGERTVVSRPWVLTMLAGAAGVLGLAAIFPLAWFLPDAAKPLASSGWRKGLRLVREDGTPVRATDLEINSVLTVFPEGSTGDKPDQINTMANAATMLIRVPAEALQLPPERTSWAPQGLIAYSKVCTHAGCPVALYRAASRQLFCPCHHSTFDVLQGCKVVFGPAGRPLPQLPIAIAPDGTLVAQGDYPEPVGPDYWEEPG